MRAFFSRASGSSFPSGSRTCSSRLLSASESKRRGTSESPTFRPLLRMGADMLLTQMLPHRYPASLACVMGAAYSSCISEELLVQESFDAVRWVRLVHVWETPHALIVAAM